MYTNVNKYINMITHAISLLEKTKKLVKASLATRFNALLHINLSYTVICS